MDYENYKDMLPDEILKAMDFLKELLGDICSDMSTIPKIVRREKTDIHCPYCNSESVIKNGHTKKHIQRYKCKDCNRRFNDSTKTPCGNTKLSYQIWLSFFECMIDKLSIRKTAAKLELNKNTIFTMRHKVLNALSNFRKSTKLAGEIQVDEKYESINLKGMRKENMPRASKPRKSKGGSKRGISSHQVCIASAIDEHDNIFFEIVGNGPITSNMVEQAFNTRIKSNSVMITDCKSSYEQFAHDNNIELEQVKSGTYKNLEGFTLSEINGLHSNLDLFLRSFAGVSTKHLQGYLDWFVYQKYLNYAVEVLQQSNTMINYVISNNSYIKVEDIYKKSFPIDIYEVYSDYNFTPSPVS